MSLERSDLPEELPYKDESTNLIYNLLFCDDISLYEKNNSQKNVYPWNILFSDKCSETDLQKIIDDSDTESRVKILAYKKLIECGFKIEKKDLLAITIEIGLDNGLDALACYKDGSARYINQSGKIIIWDAADETTRTLTEQLFTEGLKTVAQIGPWGKPRLASPSKDKARISFIVSGELYFGEAQVEVLFDDPLAKNALYYATQIVKHLTDKALQK